MSNSGFRGQSARLRLSDEARVFFDHAHRAPPRTMCISAVLKVIMLQNICDPRSNSTRSNVHASKSQSRGQNCRRSARKISVSRISRLLIKCSRSPFGSGLRILRMISVLRSNCSCRDHARLDIPPFSPVCGQVKCRRLLRASRTVHIICELPHKKLSDNLYCNHGILIGTPEVECTTSQCNFRTKDQSRTAR